MTWPLALVLIALIFSMTAIVTSYIAARGKSGPPQK